MMAVASVRGILGEEDPVPSVERPREDLVCLLVDPPESVENMIPRSHYILKISLGDEERVSEGILILRRLRGRMWPEYYREYMSRFDFLLKIHGVLWASNRLISVNPANPLSVLLMASRAIDPRGSISIVTVREEENISLPEAVNSYSVLKVSEGRRIPYIIITERFLEELSGYTEEWGYIDSREALSYIIRILSLSHREVFRSVSEDLDLGVSSYGVSALIGGSSNVFKSVSAAMRAMILRASVNISPRSVSSLHIIAAAPRSLEKEIEQSYREHVKEYEGLLNHTLHIFNKDTKLGLYDIVALIGVGKAPEFRAIEKLYKQLVERNPEARVENLLGDLR